MTALGGGFKGSMQHPLRASNGNTNSMLDLYLFKGRDSPVTFTRSNQDSRRLWRTVGKPRVSKPWPLLRAVLRRPVEPAAKSGHWIYVKSILIEGITFPLTGALLLLAIRRTALKRLRAYRMQHLCKSIHNASLPSASAPSFPWC